MFRNGINAKQVQQWLGHHSPAFTLATYVHLLPDDLPSLELDTQSQESLGAPFMRHERRRLGRSCRPPYYAELCTVIMNGRRRSDDFTTSGTKWKRDFAKASTTPSSARALLTFMAPSERRSLGPMHWSTAVELSRVRYASDKVLPRLPGSISRRWQLTRRGGPRLRSCLGLASL